MIMPAESLAQEFARTRLACIVWVMSKDDLEELKSLDEKAYNAAMGELGEEK